MADILSIINEQTFLYFTLTAFILACFRACLLRIPYATIVSTLISTCGLAIGLMALYDATNILEHLTINLLKRNNLLLNDLKVGYIFVALFIIIVIIFNLAIGFVATDQSLDSPSRSRFKSSSAIVVLHCFLAFNYIIYYLLLVITIISFIALYTNCILKILCTQAPGYNWPTDDAQVLDLRQFAPVIGVQHNDSMLLYLRGPRLQSFCTDYVAKIHLHVILCSIGFFSACAGFVNYLINFSANSAKLSTKQKIAELIYLNSELSPL